MILFGKIGKKIMNNFFGKSGSLLSLVNYDKKNVYVEKISKNKRF